MTQADDKKSAPDTKIPDNSPVAESGLPDAQSIDRPAGMSPGDGPAPFQPDDLERTKKAGFAHHVVKPVDMDALHKLLKSMRLGDSQIDS